MRVIVLFVLALCACEPRREAVARLVHVRVADDLGVPIPGASLELDGLAATKTHLDGTARVSLAPSGSPRARIGIVCPTAFRPAEPRHVTRASGGSSAPLELSFVCRPKLRTLVVVARVPGGSGMTLRADGEPLGTIGADGTLHAVITRAPDSDLRLALDTADSATTPRDPVRELRVADRDELVVFDQVLAPVTRAQAKGRAAVPKKEPMRSLPYAIRGMSAM